MNFLNKYQKEFLEELEIKSEQIAEVISEEMTEFLKQSMQDVSSRFLVKGSHLKVDKEDLEFE